MICAWTVDDKWDKMIHGKNKKQYMRIIIKEKYMNRSHWIWYPGDFEIYHGMMQNFSREERGFIWPAYYHLDDCRKHVRFTREYNLEKEETVTVYANCLGYYRINDVKKRFGEPVVCGPGKQKFEIYAGMPVRCTICAD